MYSIIGYQLSKTLSEHGTVSRGVCQVDANNDLISIKERTKIYKNADAIVYEDEDGKHDVSSDSSVSMNFWCFHPALFSVTEKLFHDFVKQNLSDLKSEFFIPIIAENFMHHLGGEIKVIQTSAQWFGVTYKEDAPSVKESIDTLVASAAYPQALWK